MGNHRAAGILKIRGGFLISNFHGEMLDYKTPLSSLLFLYVNFFEGTVTK